MSAFDHAVADAQRMGRVGRCTCWDCLRRAGITPPRKRATRFHRRYPYTIMRTDNGEANAGAMRKVLAEQQADAQEARS